MKTDQEITEAIVARMWKRREREQSSTRARFTMCYAVSVATGNCYVGYNMNRLNMTSDGTGGCAENRAVYVAKTYGEGLGNLVLFTINDRGEYFNACQECQTWTWQARGFLRKVSGNWKISTARFASGKWTDHPLKNDETETLYGAGLHSFDSSMQEMFGEHGFL